MTTGCQPKRGIYRDHEACAAALWAAKDEALNADVAVGNHVTRRAVGAGGGYMDTWLHGLEGLGARAGAERHPSF